jgi:hypothetical protein
LDPSNEEKIFHKAKGMMITKELDLYLFEDSSQFQIEKNWKLQLRSGLCYLIS